MTSSLPEHLSELLAFLDQRGLRPPTRQILVVEIVNGMSTDGAGRLRVRRQDFLLPELFEVRFAEIIGGGRRWVNLSCVGADGDSLIVSVESGAPGATTGTTSVNYSGPSAAAVQHDWRADETLLIE